MDAGGEGEIKKGKISVADRLVNIGMRGIRLFHTPDGVGYAAVTLDNGGTAILGTEKTEMRKMLSQRYYKEVGKAPSGTAVADALGIISGIALFDGDEITLNTRVAWEDGNIIYDMSNPKQECVVVTSKGWEVMQSREPMFKRFAHQVPQTTPIHGGDITKVFDSANVAEEDKLMTLVHLVSSMVPNIPHPAPSICGEQGTAKSTASKVFKLLIDPSEIGTATMPVNDDRMHQMLSKHHYLIFDNVSWIQDWQSDVFCRAVTGQATALRKLYTDDDDHIFKYKMCVGFNGITYLATRSDLLDRSFALRLVPITDAQRLPEDEVDMMFEANRGEILGGIFDALAKAIEKYPEIKLERLPRMADFTKWGCAIAESLGYTQGEFLEAYYTKIEESNMNAIDANPVAGLIMELMKSRDVWEGSPTELYNMLLDILSRDGARAENVKGLTSPRALGKIHDRLSPNLRKIGIDWRILPRTTKGRIHQLVKSNPTTTMDDTKNDDNDDKTPNVVCAPNVSHTCTYPFVEKGGEIKTCNIRSTNDMEDLSSLASFQQTDNLCEESTGRAIMEFIENKMKSYGSFETDHKFDVVFASLEDSGYNTNDIKFCMERYREGHRMFIPQMKVA